MELNELRNKIDSIDDRIAELFIARMDVVTDIAKYKKANNVGINHSDREKAIISRITKDGRSSYASQLESLFRQMMTISRNYQKELNEKE